MDRWRDAVSAFREAEEADPVFPETHSNLAHVLTSLGALEEAERHVRLAVRLLPSDAKQAEQLTTWEEKTAARQKARWEDARRKELDERDGPMSREERMARFQQVVGRCGMDKDCMRAMLGQDDDSGDEMVRF